MTETINLSLNSSTDGSAMGSATMAATSFLDLTYSQSQGSIDLTLNPMTPPVLVDHTYAERASPFNVVDFPNTSASVIVASPQQAPIDLTGDIVLTEKHSSAPLFQKYTEPTGNSAGTIDHDPNSDEFDFDRDFDEINIRYKFKENTFVEPFRRHQRYFDLYKRISETKDIPIQNIFLHQDDKRILYEDTPHGTGHKISTILVCRVMKITNHEILQQSWNENRIELKFQSDHWKRPIAIKVSKVDNFMVIEAKLNYFCEL